ncbi:1-acyl-sn-glycerol-3-phosphate acyltransferase [Candidatus Terasakiella magnetica]|nr:1-acyl-sn-glycerol-3-phosphate acyltransferase [Candidatus Terasakiella magnetica]
MLVSTPVAILRFLAFVLWTLMALIPFSVVRVLAPVWIPGYVRSYWRVVIRLIGFEVVVHGVPLDGQGPTLYVANHASYLDIIVLGSVLRAYFVAKSEVAGWAGFGFLARFSRTVFIDRRPGAAQRESNNIRSRLEAGDSLILFPEGTSNDGNRVLPFKSAILSVAEGDIPGPGGSRGTLPVQPVSVAYTKLDGLPMSRALRPLFAWYGDMTLAGHLLAALGVGKITVEVEFHPAVTIADLHSRKALARHCHKVVDHGTTRLLAGRSSKVKAANP